MKYLLVFALFTLPIFSSPRWIQNYSYVKELKPSTTKTNQEFGKFDLDEDIYKTFYDYDLRVSYKGKQLPYIRRIKQIANGKVGKVSPKIIYSKESEYSMNYVLELPIIPGNSRLESIDIKAVDFFETSAKVYLGNEIDDWKVTKDAFIFKYNNDTYSESLNLKLDTDYYKYIRIETDYKDKITFASVQYGPKDMISHIEYNETVPEALENGDLKASQYYFDNETAKPFQIIRLEFKELDYNREYTIYKMNEEKEYISHSTGTLQRSKNSQFAYSEIYLNDTVSSSWKLVIFNKDSESLKLTSIKLYQPKEECIVKLPEDWDGKESFQVYYGNQYASLPGYDTSSFNDTLYEKYTNLSLSEQIANPEKAWSVFEPPVSIWLTRFIFILGLLITVFYGFKILERWSRLEKTNPN
ncbi:MAG: hypothetical protein CK427_04645 [Leptospira sp.]|nr:MAG: hypothetical protein CK427_04645 [Leptospira sp.]